MCDPTPRNPRVRAWRVWLATALLLCGVGCVTGGLEVLLLGVIEGKHRPWWLLWELGGLVCLLFVPALIVDHAAAERRAERRPH